MAVDSNCLWVNADFLTRLYKCGDCKEKMRVLLFSLALLASLKVFHSAPPAVSTETLKRKSDITTSLHEVNSVLLVTMIHLICCKVCLESAFNMLIQLSHTVPYCWWMHVLIVSGLSLEGEKLVDEEVQRALYGVKQMKEVMASNEEKHKQLIRSLQNSGEKKKVKSTAWYVHCMNPMCYVLN